MPYLMTRGAEPIDIERQCVVVMVYLGYRGAAQSTGLWGEFAASFVDVGL